MESQIIIYQTENGQTKIETRLKNETVWLSQDQMSIFFQRERSVITKHIGNVFEEGKLQEKSNVQNLHISGSDKPMTEKFQNKYRISSARLQNWDYGSNAAYFITICTQDRECFFGEIADQKMESNNYGQIAANNWLQIPFQFPYAKLGDFVEMPNHVQGILVINKSDDIDANGTDDGGITGDKNPMIHQNVSRIIRWYKGRCTFEIRKIQSDFGWQSRFHDHIIRNALSYQNIAQYIIDNPKKWNADKFYKHG